MTTPRTSLETRTGAEARAAGNVYTVRPVCAACGYKGRWTHQGHAEDLIANHTCFGK